MRARPDDVSLDTERPLSGGSRHDLVARGLEDILDGVAEVLQEEIDFLRSKSEPPEPGPDTQRSGLH
jgi:hypothetical protein